MNQAEPRPARSRSDDEGDPARRQAMVRRTDAHEHRPVLRGRGAPIMQVADDRFADVVGQRQPFRPRALATHDQLTRAPVDVLQREDGNLAGAQPQPRQHGQDRQIPESDHGRPVARVQQRIDLAGLQSLRQPRQPPPCDRRDRAGQRTLKHALQMQEPKQRPQRHDRQLRGAAPQSWTHLDDEPAHLSDVHAPQLKAVRAVKVRHERANLVRVATGSRWHQATLVLQIPPKPRKQLLDRTRRRRAARRRHDTERAQIPKQRIESSDRRTIGVPRRAARRGEALRHVRRQARHSDTLGRQPAAQRRHQSDLLAHRLRLVSLPRQLRGEPGHERPKRPRHSYSRHFSDLDRLLSGGQHVGDDLGRPAQIMYPSSGPDDAVRGDFLPGEDISREFP
jgi:hypothetical protein